MIITIDGGSATGKTTVATALSERFEIPLLESGSLYRALVFKALQEKISIEDTESVKAFVSKADLKMSLLHRKWLLLVNDDLIKPEDLRQLEVTQKVSILAKIPEVRQRLLSLQRSCVSKTNPYLIAEGRDLGSVVFPEAQRKIYLKVSDQDRADRRHADFERLGVPVSKEAVDAMEADRDQMDQKRKVSPLTVPKGALLFDTTGKAPHQSVQELIGKINFSRKRSNLVYLVMRVVGWLLGSLFRLSAKGTENIPRQGGFIIASNHSSHLDPPALGFTSFRTLAFVARSSLFNVHPLFAWFIRSLNAFPINRESPDKKTMTHTLHLLLDGFGVVFFPEGTRSRDGKLGVFKKGIGFMALRTLLPVIPVSIEGTDRAMTPGSKRVRFVKVTVRYGPPVDLSDFHGKEITHERSLEAAARVREAILKLQRST